MDTHKHTNMLIDTPDKLLEHLNKRACWAGIKKNNGPVTSLYFIADRCLEARRRFRPSILFSAKGLFSTCIPLTVSVVFMFFSLCVFLIVSVVSSSKARPRV